MSQNEMNEAKALIENVSEATNSPKFGVFEQVVCSHIYQAGNTPDPLRKIQLLTDAALMLDPKKAESLKIDVEKTKVISIVNNALQTAAVIKKSDHTLIKIKFPFNETPENYKKYLAAWLTKQPRYYPYYIGSDIGQVFKRYFCYNCNREVGNEIDGPVGVGEEIVKGYPPTTYKICKYCKSRFTYYYSYMSIEDFLKNDDVSEAIFFFRVCEALTQSGFVTVQNCFISYALPFVLDLTRRLSESVRPEIYLEIAKIRADIDRDVSKNVH